MKMTCKAVGVIGVLMSGILCFASVANATAVVNVNKISSVSTYPDGSVVVTVHKADIAKVDGDQKDYNPCIIENSFYPRLDPNIDSKMYKSTLALIITAATLNKKILIHSVYKGGQGYACTIESVTGKF